MEHGREDLGEATQSVLLRESDAITNSMALNNRVGGNSNSLSLASALAGKDKAEHAPLRPAALIAEGEAEYTGGMERAEPGLADSTGYGDFVGLEDIEDRDEERSVGSPLAALSPGLTEKGVSAFASKQAFSEETEA